MTDLRAGLEAIISWWDTAGVDVAEMPAQAGEPRKKPALSAPKKMTASPPREARAAPRPAAAHADMTPLEQAKALAEAAPTREALFKAISSVKAGELSFSATQPVFYRGNPEAKIMVIGEAPGLDEDREGRPFVGKSGQLLDRIFAAIGLSETELYITTVVNLRAPNDRKASPEELAFFAPFIARHIALVRPEVIVLVGTAALSTLTGKTGIMKERGQWTDYHLPDGHPIPALPVYNIELLLSQPALKADMWRDMISLKARLEEISGVKP